MTVKAKLSEFAETTSMHGIAHINSAGKILLKIFWSVVVIGGIIICIWYIYTSVMAFLTFPVLVQTEVKSHCFERTVFQIMLLSQNLKKYQLVNLEL